MKSNIDLVHFILILALVCFSPHPGYANLVNPFEKIGKDITSKIWDFLGDGSGCLYNEELYDNNETVEIAEEACVKIVCQALPSVNALFPRTSLKLVPLENCECTHLTPRNFDKLVQIGFKRVQKTLKKLSKHAKLALSQKFNFGTKEGCYFNGRMVLAGGIATSPADGCAQLRCNRTIYGGLLELSIFVNHECTCSVTTTTTTTTTTTEIPLTTTFGMTDAMTTDGMTDGMTTDGMTTDGMTTDGMTTDGMTDGMTTDGMTDGMTTDGMTDAMTTDGMTDAMTTDGMTDAMTTDRMTDAMTTDRMTGGMTTYGTTGGMTTTRSPITVGPEDPCFPYKEFTPTHSMCLPIVDQCRERNVMSEAERNSILTSHNKFRSTVASGLAYGRNGYYLPMSSNMKEMIWNQELADIAQAWSRQCTKSYDCHECRRPVKATYTLTGQNAFKTNGLNHSSDVNVEVSKWDFVIEKWSEEKALVDQRIIDSFQPQVDDREIGYFTQLVWAESYEIGCAKTNCCSCRDRDTTSTFGVCEVFICNYGPSGNVVGKPVYLVGPSNSMCQYGPSSLYPKLCRPNIP